MTTDKADETSGIRSDEFRTLFYSNPQPMWVYDLETLSFLEVNDAAQTTYGYTAEEFRRMTIKDIRPAEDVPKLLQNVAEITDGYSSSGHWRHLKKDGSLLTVEISSHTMTFNGRKAELVMALDVTDRLVTEQRLRENELRLRQIADNIKHVFWMTNPEKTEMYFISPAYEQIWGRTTDELYRSPMSWMDAIHEEDRERVRTAAVSTQREGTYNEVYRIVRPDGTIRWIRDRAFPVKNERGEIYRISGFAADITEYVESERALQESETRFRTLADTASAAIFIYGTKFTYVNPAGEILTGYTSRELLMMNFWDIVHPEHRAMVRQRSEARLRGESVPNRYEFKILRKDGEIRWIEFSAGLFKPNGTAYAIGTAFDITKRKRAEEKTAESERQLLTLMNNLPGMVYRCANDAQWTTLFLSNGCEALTGYQVNDLLMNKNIKFSDIIHPEDLATVWDTVQRSLDKRTSYQIEYRIVTADGTIKWVWEQGQGVFSENGEFLFLEGFIMDINDRKKSEEELFLKSQELDRYFTSSLDLLCIADTDGYFRRLNPEWETTLGYKLHELEGRQFFDFVHPDDIASTQEAVSTLQSQHEVTNFVNRYRHKNGSYRWLEWRSYPQGKLIYATARDITVRIHTEAALRESETRYRQIFENDLTGNYISTPQGRIIDCNNSFLTMYGFKSREEALHVNAEVLYASAEDRSAFLARLKKERSIAYHESNAKRIDGTTIHTVENVMGVFNTEGELVEIRGYLIDDTKRKELERQFMQAQKMESIGTLAGGIAHDFNNILAIVLGNVDLMSRVRDNFDKQTAGLDAIAKATRRGAALVKQILTFARKTESSIQPVRINDVVEEIRLLVKETFPKTIDIDIALDPTITTISADHTQLHQAVLNLVVNARDAMPSGGILSIRTARMSQTELVGKFINGIADEYACISVRDTGTGMDAKTKEHIFEPFFTTKEKGKGTGLGLATVYGVVKSHNGHIEVESTPGEGTVFHLYFPMINAQTNDTHQTSTAGTTRAPGSETILVVEDEEVLSDLAKKAFTANGYTILTADNGEDGFNLYQQHMDTIALVFSDMDLPKQTGYEMFKKIKQLNPKVKFIIASGYLEPELKERITKEGVYHCLQKPYEIDEVLRIVRNALQ